MVLFYTFLRLSTYFILGINEKKRRKIYFPTSSPLASWYLIHFDIFGLQYSNMYASAYSIPWPFPNRPCVSVAVIIWTVFKSIWIHSSGSVVACFNGHHAPPFLSVRTLKKSTISKILFRISNPRSLNEHSAF